MAHIADLWRCGVALGAGFVFHAGAAQANTAPLSHPIAPTAAVAFNQPIDQPLAIDVGDVRLLPDGRRVRFDAHYRLSFAPDGHGWIASLLTLQPGCDGPAHLCEAFRSALQPLSGRERRAAITRDGSVQAIAGPQSSHDLVGDDAVSRAIDTARAGGSDVATAEIVEALAYVGMPLAADGDGRLVHVAANHVDISEPLALPAGTGSTTMTMRKTSRVDRATGLVIASDIDVHRPGNPTLLISHREWRLRPTDTAVP